MLFEEIKNKGNEIFNNKYDYSLIDVVKTKKDKFPIVCPEHGVFYKTYEHHIRRQQGCPECAGKKRYTNDDFINKCKSLEHTSEYSYENVKYVNNKTKVKIYCHHKDNNSVEHGEFMIVPGHFLSGQGCPKCRYLKSANSKRRTLEQVIEIANKVHKNKYDYSLIKIYKTDRIKYPIVCSDHGVFYQTFNNHIKGKQGCPKCIREKSVIETELFEYVKSLLPDEIVEENNRTVLNGKEIDVYVPNLKIGFEMNGLVWHSERFMKDSNYHLLKTEEALKNNVQLIQVFGDEWMYKKQICKSMIRDILGVYKNNIFVNQCLIKEVPFEDTNAFLESNHIEGKYTSPSINIGLYYNDVLVQVMIFVKESNNNYNLMRLSTALNTNIIGGANEMFKYFTEKYNPDEVISYVDRRWSNGNLYEMLGFQLTYISKPHHTYVVNYKRFNQHNNNKESYKVYDCGYLCYKWKKTNNHIIFD